MTLPDPAPSAPELAEPEDAPFHSLHPRIVVVWTVGMLLAALAICVALAIGWMAADHWLASPVALVVGLGALTRAVLLPRARYRAWGFRVGADDLRLRRGVFWKAESVVPHARIQHVDTRQGPLERTLGLASVIVYTAGSTGAVLAIPGLDAAEAEALRDRLARLGGADDAV